MFDKIVVLGWLYGNVQNNLIQLCPTNTNDFKLFVTVSTASFFQFTSISNDKAASDYSKKTDWMNWIYLRKCFFPSCLNKMEFYSNVGNSAIFGTWLDNLFHHMDDDQLENSNQLQVHYATK